MTLTLHKRQLGSQLRCRAVMSLQFTHVLALPAEAGTKVANGLFYCWSLLRNDNMATNLQRFTSCYGSRRFACMWMLNAGFLPSNATRQWRATYIYTLLKEAWVNL